MKQSNDVCGSQKKFPKQFPTNSRPCKHKNLIYNKKKIPNILNHGVVNNRTQPFLFPKFTPSEKFFNQDKFSLYFIHAKMNQNTTNPKI